MSKPQSRIFICNYMGLTNDYRHTIFFESLEDQENYFMEKVAKTYTDYTYLRKNWSIKVVAPIEEAETWSYLFFTNTDGTTYGKTYYYFITDVKYLSDTSVELELEMDVMQTYMFDYNLKQCFVEREHSATDEIGDNTVDEGLELGHLINMSVVEDENLKNNNVILIMSSVDLIAEGYPNVNGSKFGNVYSGCNVYRVPLSDLVDTDYIKELVDNMGAKADGIVTIWSYPESLLDVDTSGLILRLVKGGKTYEFTFNRPTSIDGYTPKNKKLFTYPYNFLYVSNNNGGCASYRYERFADNAIEFEVYGAPLPDGGVKTVPKNYNGVGYNHEEALVLTGFPTSPWNADGYKIWLAQNQHQRAVSQISSAGTMVAGAGMALAGVATANPLLIGSGAGTLVHGATSTASLLAQQKDMEAQPAQSRGTLSATLNSVIDQFTFSYYAKSITAERAKIIDEYFTLYGYKTNRVKMPNRNVRQSFTYTKTVDCQVSGNLCESDRRKIEAIYNNGITFWNKSIAVGNYYASNRPK